MKLRDCIEYVFPSFSDSPEKRTKPRDMVYLVHEKPPMSTVVVLGIQHALVLLMLTVYVVVAGREIGLSEAELRSFISVQIIVLGIGTLIQGVKTRFSSGQLIVHTPSIISAGTFVLVVNSYGIGAAGAALIISGVVILVLSRFLSHLQSVFPPEVTGVLLFLLGLSLVEGGITRFTGINNGAISSNSVLIAFSVLACIVAFSIWASEKIRVFAIAIGVVSGLIIALILGEIGTSEFSTIAQQPLVSFPFVAYQLPTPTLIASAAIPLILIEVISAVDSIGAGIAIDKMNDEKWKRADMFMVSRLVSARGLSVILNGITGTLSSGTSSANLGLVHATGVAARVVGVATGLILIAAAFLPQVSAFITLLPQPIIGAIGIYTAGFMFVSGMQLILSRMINSRRMFLIGISVTVGSSIILMPELTTNAPDNLKPILGSGLAMGTLTAIALNLLFKIGMAQTAGIPFSGSASFAKISDFLTDCGADWGARPEIINKSAYAAIEVIETLEKEELLQGDGLLKATFDEYKVVLEINYPGEALSLEPLDKPDLEALMDEDGDDALDAAMSSMSGALIRNLADRVTSRKLGHLAEVKLYFDH